MREVFQVCDEMPGSLGFKLAIQGSAKVAQRLYDFAKQASLDSEDDPAQAEPLGRVLGGLAQLWKSPTLEQHGVPQRPSSLGQMLVMGSLGSLAGYGVGRVVDHFMPNDVGKASRIGTAVGGLAGMTPGIMSAILNAYQGKHPFLESFYQTKDSGFGDPLGQLNQTNIGVLQNPQGINYGNQFYAPINVDTFNNTIWNPHELPNLPVDIRAAASGLVSGAAHRPDRIRNSPFVTPLDITRMAVGMGSGLASGWLVGKTMGLLFGTGQKTQDLLKNTGLATGLLRTVVPAAYGYPY